MAGQGRSLDQVTNRWTFAGYWESDSPLHVGAGGGAGLFSDSPIVRDALGRPYMPASTLKGALRAAVDRLGPIVGARRGLTSCALSPLEERCPSPRESPARQAVESALREFSGSRRERDEQLLSLLEERLCSSCRLFGSPWLAGRVFFTDALAVAADDVPVEIRDSVSLDRDTNVAREATHVSYEVIPSMVRLSFLLEAENLDEQDLALLAIGFSELERGAARVGGGISRGLGICRLHLEQVRSIDFRSASREAIVAYVTTQTMIPHDLDEWRAQQVHWLMWQDGSETTSA